MPTFFTPASYDMILKILVSQIYKNSSVLLDTLINLKAYKLFKIQIRNYFKIFKTNERKF